MIMQIVFYFIIFVIIIINELKNSKVIAIFYIYISKF